MPAAGIGGGLPGIRWEITNPASSSGRTSRSKVAIGDPLLGAPESNMNMSETRFGSVGLFACSGLSLLVAAACAVGDVTVTFDVGETWDSGFSGSIAIDNEGPVALDAWELVYEKGPAIGELWNGDWSQDDGSTTISDLGWNATIPVGGSILLGYNGVGAFASDVAAITVNGETASVRYGPGVDDDDPDDGGGPGDDQDDNGNDDGSGNEDDDTGDQDSGEEDDGGEAGDGEEEEGPAASSCPADVDGSGSVDGGDLGLLLAEWGGSDPRWDLDRSGTVDGGDLGLMLAAWGPCPQPSGRRVVAYYIEWGTYGRDYQPQDIPWESITHLNYAFADIDASGRVALFDTFAAVEKSFPGDSWDQPIRGLINQINFVHKPQHPHVRTLISVGGWTLSGRFSDVALTEESRRIFAESCIDFIRTYGFDGVDIDWEYPVEGGLASNVYRPEDGVNYTLLLRELRSQLDAAAEEDGKTYELSIAAPAGYDKIRHLECDAIGGILDFVNVMTYDMRGAWDLSKTGHHAPLYANPDEPGGTEIRERYTVDWSLQEYLSRGIPASKLVMGVPMYGRAWGGVAPGPNGSLFAPAGSVPPGSWDDWASGATGVDDFDAAGTSREGIVQLLAGGSYQRFWDDVSKVPYLYSESMHGGHFISYEDAESLGHKLDYVEERGLGGVMYWDIPADRGGDLIGLISDRLLGVGAPGSGP